MTRAEIVAWTRAYLDAHPASTIDQVIDALGREVGGFDPSDFFNRKIQWHQSCQVTH